MARTNNIEEVYKLPKNNYWDTRIKPRLDEVRKWCAEGFTETQIALKLGMSPGVFSKYKLAIPVLKDLVGRGRTEATHNVENSLYKLCMGYRYTRTKTVDGPQGTKDETIEEVVPPNVTAIQYFLNNRASDRWRSSAQAGNTTNVQANIQQNTFINKDGSTKGLGRDELKNILGRFDNEFMIIGSADGKETFAREDEFNPPAKLCKEDERGMIVEDDDFSIEGLPEDMGEDFGMAGLKDGESGLGETNDFETEAPPEFEVDSGLVEELAGVRTPGIEDKGDFGQASKEFREALMKLDEDFVVEEVPVKVRKGRRK